VSRKCSICTHKNRCQIDDLILAKTPYNTIAHQFKIKGKDPIQTIKNHVRYKHIPKAVEDAAKLIDNNNTIQIGLNISKCAQEIYDLCLKGAKKAEAEDLRALGSCISPAVKVLELLGKGDERPLDAQKDSGFSKAYLKRAKEVYALTQAKDQGPPI